MKGVWLFLILGGLGIVATPSNTAAGDCYARPRSYYAQSYTPSYSYYTPSYTPAYTPPCYETKLKTVPYPTSPDYYSSVNDYYRDKLLVDALAGKTAEVLKTQQAEQDKARELTTLREEVQQLRQRLIYQPQPSLQYQQPPQQPPYQQPPPQAPPPQYQQQPEQSPQQPPRQEQPKMPKATASVHPVPPKLPGIVQQHCARCHGATFATAGGGIDLRDLAAVPDGVRRAAAQAVEDGTMPRGGKNLADVDYQEFRVWSTGRRAAVAQK